MKKLRTCVLWQIRMKPQQTSSKTLRVLSKDKLIDLLLETLDELRELSMSMEQCDKALTVHKDHTRSQ